MVAAAPLDPTFSEATPHYAEVLRRAASAGPVTSSHVFAWVMQPLMRPLRREFAWLAMIDGHARMMQLRELQRGEADRVVVCQSSTCADVAQEAVDGREPYAILCHNHPAGWAWPSNADAELTCQVSRALHGKGVLLLDHVILSHDEHFSFREGQLWKQQQR